MATRSAREGGSSKSDLIRAYKQEHPDLGPTKIAAELSEKTGLKFSPSLVSNVLGKAGRTSRDRGRRAGPSIAADIGTIPEQAIAKAAELIKVAGSPEEAMRVLQHVAAILRVLG